MYPDSFQPLCHANHARRAWPASVRGHWAAHEDWHHYLAPEASTFDASPCSCTAQSSNPLPITNVNCKFSESPCQPMVHSSYDYQTLDYDIMMIKLFHPVTVTDSVMPISLPSGCVYAGAMCSVSGWGDNNSEAGEQTEHSTPSVSLFTCDVVPFTFIYRFTLRLCTFVEKWSHLHLCTEIHSLT